ncbi:MAG TPA: hypothetical protein VNX28_11935 [Gemmataceae bacterium]|jgi:hypothetical protein|nr:hypothetical protein [Gemmataceae bacterium]
MEEELDLFRQTIDGVYFWEHVRFYIFLELQRCLGLADIEPFQQKSPWLRWGKQLCASLAGLVLHNPYMTTPKTVLFFGCPRRTPDKSGVWWDTTVDPFLDSLAIPSYYIERYCGGRHCTPARTKSVKYHDVFSLVACGYRLATCLRGFRAGARALLLHIQSQLQTRFHVAIDVPGITLPILKTRWSLLGMYQKLLERVRPRVVFVASVNYYERIAIEVCKNLGIPVVELQHGVIGPFDLCYVYPRQAPLRCFPDYLFVYGPYWKNCLDFPLPAERIIPIGNPYLEARLKEHRHVQKTDQVVVISQPPVGAALSRFAVQLKARPDFTWPIVYRMHPYEKDWRTHYPWLRDSGITVSESRDGDIHSLLAGARMQIGVYSAAIMEGLAFGLSTYLVNLPGVEYMQPVIDRKWATLVDGPDEVVAEQGTGKPRADETFCSSNSLEWFHEALATLLTKEGAAPATRRAG